MDTQRKLELLADASQYDLACACGTKNSDDHRQRTGEGLWLYPVSLPRGGSGIMLKTLLSNVCAGDCRYCPFRTDQDVPRCTLTPEEVARVTMDYVRRKRIMGLFLSSGVIGTPDRTMEKLADAARILRRKYQYRGYIHLKAIPGASDAAIEEAVRLASAVSLNVEVPRASALVPLSSSKNFMNDIVRPMRKISELTAKGGPYARVRQTTQFVVGASHETDAEIVEATGGLYRNLNLDRVYFSAYQRGLGDERLPGERSTVAPEALLTREHRLYQVDFLLRQYKWSVDDIAFDDDGALSLQVDPKTRWAESHPAFFPVAVNRADREALLRVPGIGPVTARRILDARRQGRLRRLNDVGLKGKRLEQAKPYVTLA